MTDSELISKLTQLKEIKPSRQWADLVLSQILSTEGKRAIVRRPRPVLTDFSFLLRYRVAIVSLLLVFVMGSSLVLAQNSLPGSYLYPVKLATQNLRIYIAPNKYKPLLKVQIAQERLRDLAQVQNHQVQVRKVAQAIKKDIASLPEDIKKVDKNQKVILQISQQVQSKGKDLEKLLKSTNLETPEKENLQQTIAKTNQQVLSYIIDTTEEINRCPSYLQKKIINLKDFFARQIEEGKLNLAPGDIIKIRTLLSKAETSWKAGDCLTAMKSIDKIYQLLSIPSEEGQVESNSPQG